VRVAQRCGQPQACPEQHAGKHQPSPATAAAAGAITSSSSSSSRPGNHTDSYATAQPSSTLMHGTFRMLTWLLCHTHVSMLVLVYKHTMCCLRWRLTAHLSVQASCPTNKIASARLRPGHKGDLSYLVGNKVRVRVVQVSRRLATGDGLT
jgi:hypothetical protein